MEAILHARELYKKYLSYVFFTTDLEKHNLNVNIQHLITLAIRELPSAALFVNCWLMEILKSTLRQAVDNGLDIRVAEHAFKGLEKYLTHLVQEPWKKEFREIKMYGGYYRTRIKSVIPDCEQIFERAGYMIVPEKCIMVYRGILDEDFLPLLAFDCRVSQIVCRIITEDNSMIQDLSLSLSDVVGNFLNGGYSLHEIVLRRSLAAQKQNLTADTKLKFNTTAPPVLPRREPVILSSSSKQNMLFNPSVDHTIDLSEKQWKSEIIQNPPKWHTSTSSFYSSNPPLSTGSMSEPLAYISNTTNEHIPELPMGTIEDHMLETIKLVNKRDLLKQQYIKDRKQDSRNITGLSPLHILNVDPLSVTGNHPGNSMSKSFQSSSLADEGIEPDMSKSFLSSSKYSSGGIQQVPSIRNAFNNNNQNSFSSGYGTRNPTSTFNQFSPSITYNIPQTIYHPPSTQSGLSRKQTLSRQNAAPGQTSSGILTPTQILEGNSVSSKMYSASTFPYTASQLASVELQTQKGAKLAVVPSKSVPGYLPNPQQVAAGQILSKHHPTVCKTRSLKTDESTHLSKPVVTARPARSMDISSLWECPSCTKLNTYPETICSACSQIYVDADLQWHELNKSQAMY